MRDTDPMEGTVSELSFVFGEEVFRCAQSCLYDQLVIQLCWLQDEVSNASSSAMVRREACVDATFASSVRFNTGSVCTCANAATRTKPRGNDLFQ